MSAAVMAPVTPKEFDPTVYDTVIVDGETVQTNAGKCIEFVTADGEKLRIALIAGNKPDPVYLERNVNNERVIYQILPAAIVWRNDRPVDFISAFGYSNQYKRLIFLYDADDKWGNRMIRSSIRYRSRGQSIDPGRNILRTWVTDLES